MRAFGQTLLSRILSGVVFISFLTAWPVTSQAVDSAHVKALFANPPREYSSGPLWVWNDMLTEQQIRSTPRALAGQQVKPAFVHPRPGLMTPYLTDEWFRLWKVALDEAERLDMNLWIYDENSYPSGFAGGLVPEAMPESRGYGLAVREVKRVGAIGEEVLTVIAASGVVLTAGYMLWMLQRVWLGPVNEKYVNMPDVTMRELVTLVPLAILVMILGVYPHAVLDLTNTSLIALNNTVLAVPGAVAQLPLPLP